MALFARFTAWRARRKDRRNEKVIAQASASAKHAEEAKRAAEGNIDRGFGGGHGGPAP